MENKFLDKIVSITWIDSYGVTTGWQDINEYEADICVINSWGKVIYEDKNLISLAHNFAEATNNTPSQANGIMVIPKVCITKITVI